MIFAWLLIRGSGGSADSVGKENFDPSKAPS